MIPMVTSLFDLLNKAQTKPEFKELVLVTCRSFWGPDSPKTFEEASKHLEKVAKDDGSCERVVYEANQCRDFIKDPNEQPKPEKDKRFKILKSRVTSNNYPSFFIPAPENMTFEEAGNLARETGRPVITAQQEIPQRSAAFNEIFETYLRPTRQTARQVAPQTLTEQPNLTPSENQSQTASSTLGPGSMTEYGWYDQEIEDDIIAQMLERTISREDAIVRVFNEA